MKLGDICRCRIGSSIRKSEIKEAGTIPCIHTMDFYDMPFIIGMPLHFMKDAANNGMVMAEKGDILIPRSGKDPSGMGKVCVYMGDEPAAVSKDLILLSPKEKGNVNSIFLGAVLKSREQELIGYAEGTSTKHSSVKKIADMDIYLPDIKEQESMAEKIRICTAQIRMAEMQRKEWRDAFMSYLRSAFDALSLSAGRVRLSDIMKIRTGKDGYEPSENGYGYQVSGSGKENGMAKNANAGGPLFTISVKGYANPRYFQNSIWGTKSVYICEPKGPVNVKYVYYQMLITDWKAVSSKMSLPTRTKASFDHVHVVMADTRSQMEIMERAMLMEEQIGNRERALLDWKAVYSHLVHEAGKICV